MMRPSYVARPFDMTGEAFVNTAPSNQWAADPFYRAVDVATLRTMEERYGTETVPTEQMVEQCREACMLDWIQKIAPAGVA